VDVLIHSLDFKRQGKLQDAGMVVPMVGEDESEAGGIVGGGLEGVCAFPWLFSYKLAHGMEN
jgi:hypothetical protein